MADAWIDPMPLQPDGFIWQWEPGPFLFPLTYWTHTEVVCDEWRVPDYYGA